VGQPVFDKPKERFIREYAGVNVEICKYANVQIGNRLHLLVTGLCGYTIFN
jgi:hypothetical protein